MADQWPSIPPCSYESTHSSYSSQSLLRSPPESSWSQVSSGASCQVIFHLSVTFTSWAKLESCFLNAAVDHYCDGRVNVRLGTS